MCSGRVGLADSGRPNQSLSQTCMGMNEGRSRSAGGEAGCSIPILHRFSRLEVVEGSSPNLLMGKVWEALRVNGDIGRMGFRIKAGLCPINADDPLITTGVQIRR